MMRRTQLQLLTCICLALLAGCNGAPAAPEPIVITATPAVPTPVPMTTTPPPSPTPAPTPTVVPNVALRAAEQHLLNGEYESAVYTFQTVISQPAEEVEADVRAAAAFGLGEAALREGLFGEAVNALTLFLAQYPADSRVPWAYFLRGDALLGQSQWQAAIADFEQYLALRPGVIDSYVHERIADAYLAQGMISEAITRYEQAVQAGRGLVPLLALRERVAQVYLNTGQPAGALAQYDAILSVAQNAGYRAEIQFLAGQAVQASGDDAAAYERYRQLMSAYPETNVAYQAQRILLEAGQPVEAALRGRISFAAEDYQGAITGFHLYTSELALSEIPTEIHLMLGRAYRAVGNTNAAWTAFQTILDLSPTSPEFGMALLEQGRTRFLAGDTAGAIERYLFLADTYPNLPEAAEALWRVGYLYEDQGLLVDAAATYERLGRAYPGNEWGMDGLLRAAMVAWNQSDMATAERVLAALGATGSGQDAAAAYLWLGKLAQQSANTTQAENAYRAAAAADPGGYYSIRAEDLLAGRADLFTPPAQLNFEFNSQLELGQAEDWLRSTFGITQAEALWPMSAALSNDPRVIAGRELWALLAVDEAGEEFYDLLDDYETDPLASYQLAIWLRGFGAYPHSIVGAANIIKAANIPTLAAPPYLARMRYPAFYSNLVLPEAQARSVDPLLVFSLIRQESLFDRYATAAAGEKGLTQVIPSTGDYIADQLNWPDYQHTDLFQPYASVAFGAYYLWEQLSLFEGNTAVGLAAYNAGPGNAASWVADSGSDPDLFVEAIGFASTQGYVRRIYEHYNVYRQLYGTG
jgi:soluble lytic murein transglycosylase